jgi:hypothetical protein
MRNERYKGVNLNRVHRGKLKVRRFTSLYRLRFYRPATKRPAGVRAAMRRRRA